MLQYLPHYKTVILSGEQRRNGWDTQPIEKIIATHDNSGRCCRLRPRAGRWGKKAQFECRSGHHYKGAGR